MKIILFGKYDTGRQVTKYNQRACQDTRFRQQQVENHTRNPQLATEVHLILRSYQRKKWMTLRQRRMMQSFLRAQKVTGMSTTYSISYSRKKNQALNDVLCFYPAKTGRSCNSVQFVFQSSFQSIFLSQSLKKLLLTYKGYCLSLNLLMY